MVERLSLYVFFACYNSYLVPMRDNEWHPYTIGMDCFVYSRKNKIPISPNIAAATMVQNDAGATLFDGRVGLAGRLYTSGSSNNKKKEFSPPSRILSSTPYNLASLTPRSWSKPTRSWAWALSRATSPKTIESVG